MPYALCPSSRPMPYALWPVCMAYALVLSPTVNYEIAPPPGQGRE